VTNKRKAGAFDANIPSFIGFSAYALPIKINKALSVLDAQGNCCAAHEIEACFRPFRHEHLTRPHERTLRTWAAADMRPGAAADACPAVGNQQVVGSNPANGPLDVHSDGLQARSN